PGGMTTGGTDDHGAQPGQPGIPGHAELSLRGLRNRLDCVLVRNHFWSLATEMHLHDAFFHGGEKMLVGRQKALCRGAVPGYAGSVRPPRQGRDRPGPRGLVGAARALLAGTPGEAAYDHHLGDLVAAAPGSRRRCGLDALDPTVCATDPRRP